METISQLKFQLYDNYPNPFNPKTTINYELSTGGRTSSGSITNYVDLSIYNLLGQKVATLVSGKQKAGSYSVEWNAAGFSSGIYICRLLTDRGFLQIRKIILLE